ncbi:MAG: ATPase [Eubacterium sp.]|nr:ATPase [Eubacterium sp.]
MSSTIENIIAEMEDYIADCKNTRFSSTNIVVNRDEIEALLDELKSKTPEEIRKYQKIINNRDAILNDARTKADKMLSDAKAQTNELINEHQIMQQAYAQANEIVVLATNQAQEILDKATMEANVYKQSAVEYTDNLLKSIEALLASSIDTTRKKEESLITSLQGYLDVVTANRIEISPQDYAAEAADSPVEASPAAEPAADVAAQGGVGEITTM